MTVTRVRAPLVPIEATGPMDLLHLDFTKIKVSGNCEKELKKKSEVVNVLMVTDHFTQHTMAFVTEDTTAHTMACILYHHYFYIFGTLLCLMTDNDLAFTSEVVQELCKLFGGQNSMHQCLSPPIQWGHRVSASNGHQDDQKAITR